VAAVPIRAKLIPSTPEAAGAIDLGAVVVALALFYLVSKVVGKRLRFSPSPRALGIAVGIATIGVGGWGAAARAWLLPRGLLDLVLLGVAALAVTAALLALPRTLPSPSRRRLGWLGATIVTLFGIVALIAVDSSQAARTEDVVSIRPTRWLVVDVASKVDLDGDEYSSLFGGRDCDDFDPFINPDAIPIPGNGVDENCSGHDHVAVLPWPERPSFVPLPDGVPEPQSILLLTVDSLRWDHLSFHGYPKKTSPNIDRLAKRSVVFERAYTSAPTTRLAVPMMMTGRYGPEIRWNKTLNPWGINPETKTLGEIFGEAGWSTAAFVTAWMFKREWGYTRGFDHVDTRYAHGFGRGKVYKSSPAPHLVKGALEWLSKHKDERTLVWIHFFEPHINYVPHPGGPDFGSDKIGLYDGEIFYMDRFIGRLFRQIRKMGLEGRTAVFFLADHGELLGEHGQTVHNTVVWEEAARIPLYVHVPAIEPREVSSVTSIIDLPPTLLNLAGIDAGRYRMSGASLVPELLGRPVPEREVITEIRYPSLARALIGQRYKLIEDLRSSTSALYDLSRDPGELEDISAKHPEVVGAMEERLQAWQDYYAGRELLEAVQQATVEELPEGVERVDVRFPNGVVIEAIDLGRRSVDRDDTSLPIRLYLRTEGLVKEDCKLHVRFLKGTKTARLKGTGSHAPCGGVVPFRYFPKDALIEDVFVVRWRGEDGVMSGRLALFCDGERIRAVDGSHVLPGGQLDLGRIVSGKSAKKKHQKGGGR